MYFIGIDNGATGSVCVLYKKRNTNLVLADSLIKTPVKTVVDYHTGKAKKISRLDSERFFAFIQQFSDDDLEIYLEKPFTGSCEKQRSVISGARIYEAQLTCFDFLKIAPERIHIIPATTWQRVLLPVGKQDTKTKSFNVASRLYPKLFENLNKKKIKSEKDYGGDAVLLAHFGLMKSMKKKKKER